MSSTEIARLRIHSKVKAITIVLVAGALTLVAVCAITGRSLGIKGFVSSQVTSATHLGRAVLDSQRVRGYSKGQFTNIIFLHHSVGQNLIEQGGVREKFANAGYSFWDQGYNWQELVGPDGKVTGYSYLVPDDNTDPDGFAQFFAQPSYPLPVNTFSGLLQHEVIAFKSCFPVNNILSDQQLAEYKKHYLGIRDVITQHPDRIFIIVTSPPLNPAETNAEAARRARTFADWLKSDEYLSGHPNLSTFDFFDYLAEGNSAAPDYNMLRRAYRDGSDSHPNRTANETIGTLFVDFVIGAVERYRIVYFSAHPRLVAH